MFIAKYWPEKLKSVQNIKNTYDGQESFSKVKNSYGAMCYTVIVLTIILRSTFVSLAPDMCQSAGDQLHGLCTLGKHSATALHFQLLL